VTFGSTACAVAPRVGDVLHFAALNLYAEVSANGGAPSGGVVTGLRFRLLDPPTPIPLIPSGAGAEFRTPWNRTIDQINKPECWIAVSPAPQSGVGTGISTTSNFSLLFSEPMDPTRLTAFDTFQLLYGFTTPSLQGQVVGQVTASNDLTRFTLQPSRRLRHAAGSQETYRVSLPTGTSGPVDLAGNPLQFALTDANGNLPDFTVRASDSAIESRSLMLKFTAADENPTDTPVGNEMRGQLIYDLLNGRVRPRSVTCRGADAHSVRRAGLPHDDPVASRGPRLRHRERRLPQPRRRRPELVSDDDGSADRHAAPVPNGHRTLDSPAR
jgi:hypothetical protein